MNIIKEREQRKKANMVKIKRWPARLRKLAKRAENPLSERAFCLKHGIPVYGFNKTKNLKSEPRDKKVEQVETALAAEGV